MEAERAATLKAEDDRLDREKNAAKAEATRRAKEEAAAAAEARRREQEKEAERVATQKAEDDRLDREKRKRFADAEARRLAEEEAKPRFKAPPEPRSKAPPEPGRSLRWQWTWFPPPNAGSVLITFSPSGNPACASYNAADCLWGLTYEQVDFSRLKLLVCGAGHRAVWGTTGYEDPKHWCSLARAGKS